ncbi:synaptonemal complex protein 1 [Varanus komodoensis]|uniref:synaptonemal complex protein 1 n=1 Tax=Varanus komodoensis TaxID=61221 RepID=UPI001CF7E4F1|nr:synaptonemal complex protein 1 [Varanus komodoensis]
MGTMNELYSMLYKEAEKIKRWKVNIEYELKEKERQLQENRKITEALRKAIQELQATQPPHKDITGSRSGANTVLFQSTAAAKGSDQAGVPSMAVSTVAATGGGEHEQEETKRMYVDLNNNIEVSTLIKQNGEQNTKIEHINMQLQESRELIAESEEIRKHQDESLQNAESKHQSFLKEMEEMKSSLQMAENTCKCLETELQTAEKTLMQVTEQKEMAVEELKELKETIVQHGSVIDELQSKISNLKELLEKEERRQKELRDESNILVLELQKKSAELEIMAKLKNDKEKQAEEIARALINSLKKQIETKTKNIDEIQQENKVLRKKVAAESKQASINEGKVNKLQLEMENMNKLHKETVDTYKNETETAKTAEKELLKELETMKSIADEAAATQKEIDVRCQHKITEMVALMEKHKHQYDKTVEEKDAELENYKTKEQELTSIIGSLERELSCKKSEISSLQEHLKAEINEKKTQTSFLETPKASSLDSLSVNSKKNTSQIFAPVNANKQEYTAESWAPAKTYIVKTPPNSNMLRESTNLRSEDGRKKKRKLTLEMGTLSDSSENNDLLSIVSEEEMCKQLYKDYPQTSFLNVMTPKKIQTPPTLKIPESSVKLGAIRKMREAGWTAVSKIDRRRKMKEAGKLFT